MAQFTRLKDIHVRFDEVEESRFKLACKRRGVKAATKLRELSQEWTESILGAEAESK